MQTGLPGLSLAFFCLTFGFQLTLYSSVKLFDLLFVAFFCVLVRTIDSPCWNLINSPLKIFPCQIHKKWTEIETDFETRF